MILIIIIIFMILIRTHGIWNDARGVARRRRRRWPKKTIGVASGKSFEMNSKMTPEFAR